MSLYAKTRLLAGIMFIRECLKSPRSMGTVCPSSNSLAKKMAEKVSLEGSGLVVELGAGTGCITSAILRRGVNPGRLFIIERSRSLADVLRERFPGLKIVCGDACNLSAYLPRNAEVDCIISSLPFASLDNEKSALILSELKKIKNRGAIIQYTYLLGKSHIMTDYGFTCISTTVVWKNLPPARLMEFVVSSE